jgi:hypothetical protein
MKTKSTKVATGSTRKRTTTKTVSALANCPVNGAGWCPYPFSPAQLERRLKQKQTDSAQEKELVGSGRGKSK